MARFVRFNPKRPDHSTDERWLALALGPGLLGGFLVRLIFRDTIWIGAGWTVGWLLVASGGTTWSWKRDHSAHLHFLLIYAALATGVVAFSVVTWRWLR